MRTQDIFMANTRDVKAMCNGLHQENNREKVADTLTQVAALSFSPDELRVRSEIAAAGGLESVEKILLGSDSDVSLQCKAANALGSLCVSQDVARCFLSNQRSGVVLKRLRFMVQSNSEWAQADAIGCLGWLVASLPSCMRHELVPEVTRLMTKYLEQDGEAFIVQQGRPPDRSGQVQRHPDRVKTKERGECMRNAQQRRNAIKMDVARERIDNLRVYSLIFLLKAAYADNSTTPIMVEAGALPTLLKYLSAASLKLLSDTQARGQGQDSETKHQADSLDEDSPTLVMSARLLYIFSLVPELRAVLLKAKCIPPLLRVRQRLRERASASKGRNSESAICSQAKQEAKLVDKPEGHTKACEGKIGSPGNKTVAEQRVEISGVVEKQHVRSEAGPPLEAIINMVIDQVLGKTSYSLVARPEDQSS